MTEYTKCSELVLNMANEIIEESHPSLYEANIGFLFRDEAQEAKGKTILATAKKAPAWVRPYADLDFLIVIAKDEWDKMQTSRREALIDHELCHCTFWDGEAKILGHDIEEFHAIIERRGLWNYDLFTAKDKFANAQRPLEGFETPKKEGKVSTIEKVVVLE